MPSLLLLPGLDGTGRLFDRLLPHLVLQTQPELAAREIRDFLASIDAAT